MSRLAFTLGAALFSLLTLGEYAHAQETTRSMKEVNTLDAFSAAYTDFKRHIAKTTKGGTELDNFLSDITNYKITIYLEDGNYVVRFTPLPHNGVVLRGGGANYEIDAKTATVMKFAPSR